MEIQKDVWMISILFYDEEQGFLLGKNKENQYDLFTENVKKGDVCITDVITRCIIREFALYEYYYFQRRYERYVENKYRKKVDIQNIVEQMRQKYQVKDFDKYTKLQQKNGTWREIYPFDYILQKIVQEWISKYAVQDFLIPLQETNEKIKNHIFIFQTNFFPFTNDRNAFLGIPLFYQKIPTTLQYKMTSYEWKLLHQIHRQNVSESLQKIFDYLYVGVLL